MIFVAIPATLLHGDGPPPAVRELTAGKVLPAKWEYSTDGGKTIGAEPAKIGGTHTVPERANAARVRFTIDDPAQVGLLKIAMASGDGAFALTSAASVDRYNVGACPTMMDTKIVLNGQSTDLGLLHNTLYAHLSIAPALLKKGENTLELSGTWWHKNYDKGAVPVAIQLEVLPTELAVLDRPPMLGMVAPTYFGISTRPVIPSSFTIAVTPVDPPGPAVDHSFPKTQLLRTEVPLPAGTKRFRYRPRAMGSSSWSPAARSIGTTARGWRR